MSETVRANLEALQGKTGADSLAEVVRKALAVYDFLWTEREKGGIFVVKNEGDRDREVVLL